MQKLGLKKSSLAASQFRVAQLPAGKRNSNRIENCQQIDDFLGDGAGNRRQKPGRRGHHAKNAQTHSSDRAFERNRTHAATDMNELVHLPEGRLEDHRVRRFAGDIAVQTEGETDGRGLHGGGVIDTVPDEDSFFSFGFLPHNRNFFFRTFSSTHLTDAHRSGKVLHFGGPIS